eukprot:768098-Hanusia_phi.AAC.1
MLRIETELEREGVEARMLLQVNWSDPALTTNERHQVHDELVFEVREGDEERAGKVRGKAASECRLDEASSDCQARHGGRLLAHPRPVRAARG